MAAFRTMIRGWLRYGDLPPAGNHVVLGEADKPIEFAGYDAHWVQSGTAALALGMQAARARAPAVRNPSVILPAYGCPDLIAAAVYAGVTPKLVDIGAADPGYDLDSLSKAIDNSTVAVVAVNFLGIRERLAAIRATLAAHPQVMLIEDNAQWFPEPLGSSELAGDLVCLSFGRGKPVSLLGGGALLVRRGCEVSFPSFVGRDEKAFALKVKVTAFNALLNRRLYPLVNRNPSIELGKTQYKSLPEIRALDSVRLRSVGFAAQRYLDLPRWSEQAWTKAFASISLLATSNIEASRCGRLLRYPMMCRDVHERDEMRRVLDGAGLGVSAMYRVALPEVDGVAGKFIVAGDYANAREFAARLLTVPVHEGLKPSDIERAKTMIRQSGLILRN